MTVRDRNSTSASAARDASERLEQATHAARTRPSAHAARARAASSTLPIGDSGVTFGFWRSTRASRDADGETLAVLESFCGILGLALGRARLEHEAVLLQALKETDRLRTALLQSVSHDLRTPLTAITASASALREDVPEHEREALLGGIEHEAERLMRLVANMLDLSRIEAGVAAAAAHADARRRAALRGRRRCRRGRSTARSSTSTAPPSCRR